MEVSNQRLRVLEGDVVQLTRMFPKVQDASWKEIITFGSSDLGLFLGGLNNIFVVWHLLAVHAVLNLLDVFALLAVLVFFDSSESLWWRSHVALLVSVRGVDWR
jgi:hypothetical protein